MISTKAKKASVKRRSERIERIEDGRGKAANLGGVRRFLHIRQFSRVAAKKRKGAAGENRTFRSAEIACRLFRLQAARKATTGEGGQPGMRPCMSLGRSGDGSRQQNSQSW